MTRGWHLFGGFVTATVVATMMLPGAFGFQGYTQWGGMYVDGWCNVMTAPAPMSEDPGAPTYEIREDQNNVWYTPMHSPASCVAWARSWCGQQSPAGWPIVSAYAYHRGVYLENDVDVCALPDRPSFRWYRR